MDLPYGFERITATHGLARSVPAALQRLFQSIRHDAPHAHVVGLAAHWLFFNTLARVPMPTEWIVVVTHSDPFYHSSRTKNSIFSLEIDGTLMQIRVVRTNLWKAMTVSSFSVLQIAISIDPLIQMPEPRTVEFLMTEGVFHDITNRMCRIPYPISDADEPMYQYLAGLGYRFYDWESDRMYQLALRRQNAQLDAMERMKS